MWVGIHRSNEILLKLKICMINSFVLVGSLCENHQPDKHGNFFDILQEVGMNTLNVKIQNELVAGESVKTAVNPSMWLLASSAIAACLMVLIGVRSGSAILAFLLIVAALVMLLKSYIYIKSTQLAVTNKRTLLKFGWLRVDVMEIRNNQVESVIVNQSIFERLFGLGTVTVSGSGSNKLVLRSVPNPREIKTIITASLEVK